MIEVTERNTSTEARIIVIGVGGGGNNAVNRMIAADLVGVTFASINTDSAVLKRSGAPCTLNIGAKLLNGFGAGADPAKGEAAAIESEDEIKALISGYDMAIVTCGMGGGTGTGAAPIIAKYCKDSGLLTLGIVTMPFSFEGRPRTLAATAGVEKMLDNVDTLLVIPNDKLLLTADKNLKIKDSFVLADSVLRHAIEGVTNIVYRLGEINIDFNDLRTTLMDKGMGHLGIGTTGINGSIMDAVNQAVNSPLLDTTISGAQNLLINTSGDITLMALSEAITHIKEWAGPEANIIWGTVDEDQSPSDQIVVTIIATGLPQDKIVSDANLQATTSQATNSQLNTTQQRKSPQITPAKATHKIKPDPIVVPDISHIILPDFLKSK